MKEKKYLEPLPADEVTSAPQSAKTIQDVLSSIFNKGQSQALKTAEQAIEIKKITSKPISYIISDAFYEKRSIYSQCVPTYAVRSESDYKHSPSEYDMWEIECPSPKELFKQAKNIIQIAGSRHVTDCYSCSTTGQVPCNCGNGQEMCPSCNGNGGWNCGTCNGRGEHSCGYCRGLGYTTRHEILYYDKDNLPVWGDKKYRCLTCNGNRIVRCGNCGGSGYITCGTCNGYRYITCRTCGGSAKVTCSNCTGMGHFLDSVNIDQEFDTITTHTVLKNLSVDSDIYDGQHFNYFQPQEKDSLICEFIDDTMPATIPLDKYLSNQFDKPYDVSDFLKELEKALSRHKIEKRTLNYRVRVYQQQVLEVEYLFQGQTYHLMHNVSTQETIMDKNPYEAVASTMVNEIKEHAEQEHYKTFLTTYKEFLEITNFDNVAFSEKDIKYYMKKLSIRSGIICVLAGLITQVVACIITYFSILPFLFAIAISVGISFLWKAVANDKKEVHYAILSTLVVIAVGLFHFMLNYIFTLI